jgi:general stress protein YciG
MLSGLRKGRRQRRRKNRVKKAEIGRKTSEYIGGVQKKNRVEKAEKGCKTVK